jgi:hypothetical protein
MTWSAWRQHFYGAKFKKIFEKVRIWRGIKKKRKKMFRMELEIRAICNLLVMF